ncbi:beta-lactamase/transpeptidase-like protein [Fimicolochytrium jonesii]|uniref:beta-lactamase/transpeptidase-like protein n=1 Tax=Fimicolochytrium jonesii TaxID=1396493 RepID=UPI0022FF0A54|nr:beta-lactamase/transpeptidase-like protein [Fimicolochytrium jonesii]KAI8818825.1 beta-lactamase/transpeptidase-like protein [Fimicolochytrium jonesii]
MHVIKLITLAAFSSTAFALPVVNHNDDAPWHDLLISRLETVRHNAGVRGGSVAVVHGDKTWLHAFGHKDLEQTQPVDVDTSFLIGSCTKSFTALGAAKAVAQGKLYYDKPLNDYVRDFYPEYLGLWDPVANEKVTLADVLAHRTGVAGDFPVILAWNTTERLLQHLKHVPPSFPYNGTHTPFQYNNIMYGLAGFLTAKANGNGGDWASMIRRDIFGPLGMNASTATLDDFLAKPNRSPGLDPGTDAIEDSVLPAESAGAISSTARDFGKYAHALLKTFRGEADPLALTKEVFAPFREKQGEVPDGLQQLLATVGLLGGRNISSDVSYTFGFWKTQWRNYTFFTHGGDNSGYTANLCVLPEANLAVTVQTNADGPHGCFRDLACAVAFDTVLGFTDSTSYDCLSLPPNPIPAPLPALPLPASVYTGVFESPIMGQLVVTDDAHGNLTAAVGERHKFLDSPLYATLGFPDGPAKGPLPGATPDSIQLSGLNLMGMPHFFVAKTTVGENNTTVIGGYYYALDRDMTKICEEPGIGCQDFFKRVDGPTTTPPKCHARS